MMDIGAVRMAQQDGGAPTTLAAGSAPGESGVSVLNFRIDGGMHLLATFRRKKPFLDDRSTDLGARTRR